MLSCPRCPVVKCVRHRDDVCCSVVFVTLVGVFVFSVILSELLMTSAISCSLWSSVYECQRVECAFTSPVRTVVHQPASPSIWPAVQSLRVVCS